MMKHLVLIIIPIFFYFGCKKDNSSENTTTSVASTPPVSPNETSSNNNIVCPPNYIKVPANQELGTDTFCIMKFEARKHTQTSAAYSNDTGPLYTNLTFADAKKACDLLNQDTSMARFRAKGKFSLTTNPQWMALVRDLEQVKSNIVKDSQGTTCYKRGNTGMDQYGSNYLRRCSYGKGKSEVSGTNPLKFHETSLKETIADVSGNLYEFVRWSKTTDLAPQCPSSGDWIQVNEIGDYCPELDPKDYLPVNAELKSADGIGWAYLGTGRIPYRSGHWDSQSVTGIYLLNFCSEATSLPSIGFRCVYETN